MSRTDEDYRAQRLASVRENCLASISTMRTFLDDAERRIVDPDATPEEMIEAVVHKIAWGWANATSGPVRSLSALCDARRIQEQVVAEVPELPPSGPDTAKVGDAMRQRRAEERRRER